MIIADTSVWIEFLRQRSPVADIMEEHLNLGNILAIECVFGELLQGSKGKSERSFILEYWQNLPHGNQDNVLIDAGVYSSENGFINKGVGIIDASIIVSAIRTNSKIWTLDKKLLNVIEQKYIYKI